MRPQLEKDPSAPLFAVADSGRFCVGTKSDLPKSWLEPGRVHWILTLNGNAYYATPTRSQYLAEGWAFASKDPPGKCLKFDSHPAEPWGGIYLSFSTAFAMERMDFVTERFGGINQLSLTSECAKLARRLHLQKKPSPWLHALTAFEWFHEWWQEAEAHHRNVVRLLDARVTAGEFSREPHSLKSLADQLGYSPGYLSSLLRQRWKETPAKLLRRERLKHAAEQLACSNIRVEVLANQLGYRSVSSFIRAFRLAYNLPPEKYRESLL